MKRSTIAILQTVVILIGIAAVALLLWEPQLEGRNAHASWYQIYFNDPFLAFVYLASTPFFVALYQGVKVLGYADRQSEFQQDGARALRTIRSCAIATLVFVVAGELIIMFNDSDDRAGGVFMGLLVATGSVLIALAATRFERMWRNAAVTRSNTT